MIFVYIVLAINSASIIVLAVLGLLVKKQIRHEIGFLHSVTYTAISWINARVELEIGPDKYQELMKHAIEKSFENNPPDIDDIIKQIMKEGKDGLGKN
jgi:hypothetical protein